MFNRNLCSDFTDIDLNQFINKSFIKTDLFKLIQLNLIEAVKIDLNKKLKFNPYLLKSKLHNNIKSLDQIMLHVPDFKTQMFTPIPIILFKSENDIVMFILFN